MRSIQERRLKEFVNRDTEMDCFKGMLDENEPQIMVLTGGGGLGKSSLVAQMQHESALYGLRKVEVVVTDTRNKYYLEIMRKLRDDIGVKCFSEFTDLVNFYTVPQYELKITGLEGTQISVADGMAISGDAQVGDVAAIIIKDSMNIQPRDDQSVPESERMARLTDAFHRCLTTAISDERLLIFLDGTEKLDKDTTTWLWNELLRPIQEGILDNVNFVLSGRQAPELDRDWDFFITIEELKPLKNEHIIQYLEKRGIPLDPDGMVLQSALLYSDGGMPNKLAILADGLVRGLKKKD